MGGMRRVEDPCPANGRSVGVRPEASWNLIRVFGLRRGTHSSGPPPAAQGETGSKELNIQSLIQSGKQVESVCC